MISKAKIKYIQSLEKKKFRLKYGVFVAEGNKMVADMLEAGFDCALIAAKPSWMAQQGDIKVDELIEADNEDLHKASFLVHPQDVLGVFRIPEWDLSPVEGKIQLLLALDGIQDPGNLGTIIRLADWFGLSDIVCSMDTVDVFNPKTVQATMGALAHVKVHYVDMEVFLDKEKAEGVPIYGTTLDGDNMYTKTLTSTGIIVMGNEGQGIRPSILQRINEKLFIPNYANGRSSAESLNVAIATAVVCAEFRRRN
ncbi:MAG: RNA methyltransferase [Massilibacteroides sp.]|nr:RNA methyltransferase [Massilibacteroides sp.]